jgi:hypothetical protein
MAAATEIIYHNLCTAAGKFQRVGTPEPGSRSGNHNHAFVKPDLICHLRLRVEHSIDCCAAL